MSLMPNQFSDFRVVRGKIEQALKTKWFRMCPCTHRAWWEALEGFGIQTSHDEVYRSGFVRVADPMGGYVFNAEGDCVGTRRGTLYVPEELAMKILVLGDLP